MWILEAIGLCRRTHKWCSGVYCSLTEPSIKRCTCVNKQKKRKQVDVMKEYRQVPAAVDLVGSREAVWGLACRLRAAALSDPPLSNLIRDVEEVLSGFLKITQRAIVKSRSWVNIAVCPCFQSSLTYQRNINPFENKMGELHIFIKKCVCSFVEVRKLILWLWVYQSSSMDESVLAD